MTRKIAVSLLIILVALSMIIGLVGCEKTYGNLPIELKYPVDGSVPLMTGDVSREEQSANPMRGFSISLGMTLDNTHKDYKSTYAYPTCEHDAHHKDGTAITTYDYAKSEFEKYKAYAPRTVVLTVYLTNFVNEEKLGTNATEQIYTFLKEMEKQNVGVIMKFAYQHGNAKATPKVSIIKSHMAELSEWFNKVTYANNLLKSTIMAFRQSFVGEDGNFVNSAYTSDELKDIANTFARLLPGNGTYSQSPNVDVKNMSSEYDNLINMGFYNDNFDSKPNAYNSGDIKNEGDKYKQYVYQSMTNLNSASVMPSKGDIDGKAVLKQLKDGYFTTFDLSNLMSSSNATAKTLLDVWSETIISKKDLKKMNLPYYDEWFLGKDGTSQNRSVLDYLRDFTGYNLAITSIKLDKDVRKDPKDGKMKTHTTISFVLTNYGMAAPLFIDKFELYIKNNATGKYINNGSGLVYPDTYDPKVLVSGGQIKFSQLVIGDIDIAEGKDIPDKSVGHSIGIKAYRRRRPNNQYVRLANNVPYTDNINWIYSTKK